MEVLSETLKKVEASANLGRLRNLPKFSDGAVNNTTKEILEGIL